LNQLLEQVDAVESGGEEAVRDVRRALVRRVERALEGLPEEEVAKAKGIVINEPEVEVKPAVVAAATVVAPVVATEVEGYEIPDFLEATPAASSSVTEESPVAPAAPALDEDRVLPEVTPQFAAQSQWFTVDPTVPAASSPAISFPDEDTSTVPEVTTANAPQLDLGEPVPVNAPQTDLSESTSNQSSVDIATAADNARTSAFEVVDSTPAHFETSAAVSSKVKHDGLSDWETTSSDIEQ
jgi:hypothetical protein